MSAEAPSEKQAPARPPEPAEEPLPLPRAEEVPAVLEALLFATTTPLTLKRLSALTGGLPLDELRDVLQILKDRYEKPASGLMLMEVAGGYQLATRPSVADWVLALHKHRRKNPISPALMETLAIVAYKQPIVRAEIEAIRGVDCGNLLRSLQDAGLVEVVGQKEVPGRPSLYGTTGLFLKTFGLRDLEELPELSDLRRILATPMKGATETVSTSEDAADDAPDDAPGDTADEAPPADD